MSVNFVVFGRSIQSVCGRLFLPKDSQIKDINGLTCCSSAGNKYTPWESEKYPIDKCRETQRKGACGQSFKEQ